MTIGYSQSVAVLTTRFAFIRPRLDSGVRGVLV